MDNTALINMVCDYAGTNGMDVYIKQKDNCSLIILARGYAPVIDFPEGCIPASPFYEASQFAEKHANALIAMLDEQGYSASQPKMLLKSLIDELGGTRGKNSLSYIPVHGSFFSPRVVAIEGVALRESNKIIFENRCESCRRCINACPANAIDDTGFNDPEKCLRAKMRSTKVPESYRGMMSRMVGCDICQMVCPMNVKKPEEPGKALIEAFSFEKILGGDIKRAQELIGSNFARQHRLMAQASVIAANMDKKEYLELIKPLTESGDEELVEMAKWSVRKLENL